MKDFKNKSFLYISFLFLKSFRTKPPTLSFQRFCKWRSYSKLDRCAVSARKAGGFNALTIKTSTGFDKEGANAEDIKLMKETIGNRNLKIKASGGISNTQDAINMINAGADELPLPFSIRQ